MDNFLRYLSDEQRGELLQGAENRHYQEGEIILSEGEQRRAIFLIKEGVVRIERGHMGFNVEVSRLHPGEIFGEMSFVEEFGASASVVADSEVDVDIIDEQQVKSLGSVDAAFDGQFYRSIAEVLSRRLRETTVRSIAEYAWGGFGDEEDYRLETLDEWGGGSPFREKMGEGE